MLRFLSGLFLTLLTPTAALAAEHLQDPAKALVKSTGEPLVPLLLLILAVGVALRFWKSKALLRSHTYLGYAAAAVVLIHAGLSFYKLGFAEPSVIAAGGLGVAGIATLVYTGISKAPRPYHYFAIALLIFGFVSHKVTIGLSH